MELFCQNIGQLLAINYFGKKAPLESSGNMIVLGQSRKKNQKNLFIKHSKEK